MTVLTSCSTFPANLAQRKLLDKTGFEVLSARRFVAPTDARKRGKRLYRGYEIFEVLPDGSKVRRTGVFGLEFAKLTLEALSERTTNECFAADEKTHQVVAQINLPPAKRTIKRIFQIIYDEQAGLRRAELLRGRGYGVLSVIGNDAAKVLLTSIQAYDLFREPLGQCREGRR